jgi:glycine/betaine/sarcosine/D-proline reductase family selenoprotein B
MRRTDFSYLPKQKQLFYEQLSRSYRLKTRPKIITWTPFDEKLLDSKIALVSICGAYLKNQQPFSAAENETDYSYRSLDINFAREELNFFPLDWEPGEAQEDFNVVLPIDRLVLLQKEGMIGKVNEYLYSFSGANAKVDLLTRSVKKLIKELKDLECNGALIIPCSARTAETACLIANQIEAAKIPTALLTPFYEQAMILAPPRSAFVNFPFGRILGKANHVTLHTAILRDTLRLFEKAKIPGEIFNLNFIWSYGKIPNW